MAAMNESKPSDMAAKGALVGAVAGAAVANPTARKMIHKAVGKVSKTLGPKTPLNKRPQKEVDSILDVFNAVKKNTKGTAEQKKAQAKKVIKKHFNLSKNDLEKLGGVKKHFMRGLRRSDVSQMIKKIKDKKNIGKAVDNNAIVKDLNLTKGTKAKITKFISKVKNSGRQIDKDVVDAFYKTDLVSKKSGTAYNIGRHADKIVAGAAGSAAAGSYTKKKLKNRNKSKGGK